MVTTQYSKELNKHYKPIENVVEETTMILLAKKGCVKSRNKLINAHLKIIWKIASMYANKNSNNMVDELISIGIIGYKGKNGLVNAINDYDTNSSVRLCTFCVNYVRNSIRDYSVDNYTIRNTRSKSKSKSVDLNETYKYEADMLGMTVAEYVVYLEEKGHCVSKRTIAENFNYMPLDQQINEDKMTLSEIIADDYCETTDNINNIDLRNVLDKLTKDEMQFISMYYGINSDSHTLDELGEHFNVTKQALSIRHKKIIEKLQGCV